MEVPRYSEPEPSPAPSPVRLEAPAPAPDPVAPPRSFGLATALLLGGLVAVLAFAGGYQSGRQLRTSDTKAPDTAINPPTREAEPEIPRAKIVEDTTPAPASPKEPTLTAPRTILEAFLAAPDRTKRAEYILYPDRIQPRMEAYYSAHPDKATPWTKIEVEHCEVVDSTGFLLSVFRIHTAAFPKGYPVAVAETATGWRVDWASFVEYQDDLFQQFVTASGDGKGTYHLIVRQSPEAPKAPNRIEYEVIPFTAPAGAVQKTFVLKDTTAAAQLSEVTEGGNVATLVLQLARRTNPDGTKSFEILSVPATNWRPRDE
ncbi:MAG: hypothetical protein QM755_16965 [Luteolibacter sp.]